MAIVEKNRYSPISSLYFSATYFINLILSVLNVLFLPSALHGGILLLEST